MSFLRQFQKATLYPNLLFPDNEWQSLLLDVVEYGHARDMVDQGMYVSMFEMGMLDKSLQSLILLTG